MLFSCNPDFSQITFNYCGFLTVIRVDDESLDVKRTHLSEIGHQLVDCDSQRNCARRPISVLPRPFLQGASPCLFLVTPCPF